ncbi:unnamed protein product [Rotaria sordida]|uniref:ADP-ribosylation factor n=1 Tax=Rotaria sordida TaxID=392033 RepID=A0A818TGD9_9BILA|nr:unnamed protein product [Rotaria sordida]
MGSSWNKIASLFPKKEEIRVLMFGLDAAGKTTALYVMKLGEVVTTIPTIGFNVETVEFRNIKMTAWDVGGRDKIRPLWRHYYQNTAAIVYVIDSNDRERINEACEELHRMANEDELRTRPILVLANKQDLPNAMSVDELRDKLGMNRLSCDTKWHIQPTIATQNEGIREGYMGIQLPQPFGSLITHVFLLLTASMCIGHFTREATYFSVNVPPLYGNQWIPKLPIPSVCPK